MGVPMKMQYTVDLNAPLTMQEAGTLMVEGDNLANTIRIEVVDGDTPATLDGCSATAYMIRSDGYKPFVACTVEGNVIQAALTASFYAVSGRYHLFVRLTNTKDNTRRTLLWLNGWVNTEGGGNLVDDSNVIPTLDELLAQVEKVEEAVAKAEAIANMEVEVETLPTGSEAAASYEVGKLSLGIPRGEKGDTGDTGPKGETGVGIEVMSTTKSPDDDGYNTITFGLTDGTSETLQVKNGSKGEAGVGITLVQTSRSEEDGGENTITFHLSDGTSKTFVVSNGNTGAKGDTGNTGVGIRSIEQTTTSSEDGGTNVITATLTDGTKSTFQVQNGTKGSTGETGQRGTGILSTTTGIASYTTTVGGVTPTYRILLSTLKTQSKVSEVLVGDMVRYSYFLYPIIYIDESYAYMGTRVSIRGNTGASGSDGTDGTAATVEVGTVTALEPGSTPTVTNTGTTAAAVLNFGIPRGQDGAAGKDYSFDPTVYNNLPVLRLTGDISPIRESKDNKVTLTYVYGDRSGTCTLKGQGATSYKNAQKLGEKGKYNYTINFDTAFEAATGWGEQKKYCLKANTIDHSHSRNVVSAKLWGMIVKSRTTENSNLSGLVNGGAVDGFPIVVMVNDEFHGLYTWNIPKDGWMMGLVEDTTKTQAIVGANDHETATQFKGLLAGDESDFELEFVSDESNTAWVTTSLNTMIQACIDSWGGDLDDVVAQYLDWDSVIDYYIFIVVLRGSDMVDKNYLLSTFDGTKWHFTAYDMDSTYGLEWDGSMLNRPVTNINFVACADTHRAYELVKRFKTDALKARYKVLRADILSESRIVQKFENFAWAIPSPVLLEDVKRYPVAIPGSAVNNVDQIARWVRQRLEAADAWINALPAQETPVEPEQPAEMVNQVPISTDTDGSIYNGVGYKDNVRLSSSGGVSSSAQAGSVVTGFIPCTNNDVIRIKGATWMGNASGQHFYLNCYNSSKSFITGMNTNGGGQEPFDATGTAFTYDDETGVTTIDLSQTTLATGGGSAATGTTYVRLNAYGSGADLIVTVNQEITD